MILNSLFSEVNWDQVRIKYSAKEEGLVLRTRRAYESQVPLREITTKRDLTALTAQLLDPIKLKSLLRNKSAAEIELFKRNVLHLQQAIGPKRGQLLAEFVPTYDAVVAEALAERSVADEVGHKAANLILLTKRLKNGQIPPFLTISHQEVNQFLLAHGLDLAELIDRVRRLDEAAGEPLCEDSRKLLQEAQAEVIGIFAKQTFSHPEISEFIKTMPKGFARLMVRSTSREDTDENTNAGGNKTVPGVRPEAALISAAIGEVVASTLGEKSLVQSSRSGESIYRSPFVPVLIQLMIGENPQLALAGSSAQVSSGVMFTTEPEGGFAPMVQVQASWGHGEGVVTSRVPCDTFYLYPGKDGGLTKHAILRHKPERLVSTETGGDVRAVDNSRDQIKQSCVKPELLPRLHALAEEVRELYGKPMDIEWVYDNATDILYLVQARPLRKRPAAPPSYLRLAEFSDRSKGGLIVAAGSSVREIRDPKELIISESLGEALDRYVAMTEAERNAVKGVVCRRWAAATSHEAIIFRSESLPVLRLDHTEEIEDRLADGQRVFLDPQQETIAYTHDERSFAALTQPGWISYPIAREQSLLPLTYSQEEVIARLKELITHDVLGGQPFSAHIEALGAVDEPERALLALSAVVRVVVGLLEKYPPSEFFPQRDLFLNLCQAADELRYRLRERPIDRMAVLAAKRWLETTLSQEGEGVVAGHSLREFFIDLKARKSVEAAWPKVEVSTVKPGQVSAAEAKSLFAQYLRTAPAMFDAETRKQFESFVRQLALSRNKLALGSFNQLLAQLQKRGILTIFLNEHFSTAWEASGHQVGKCLAAMGRALKKNLAQLDSIKPLEEELQRWEGRIGQWADPAAFEGLLAELNRTLVPWMQDERLIRMATQKNLSQVERTIAMHLAARLMNCIDRSIKAMKGNSQCDATLRAQRVAQLLIPYYQMMQHWIEAIPASRFESWISRIDKQDRDQSSRSVVLQRIKSALDRCTKQASPSQLMPSGTCNIASCTVGSGASFVRHFFPDKVTLEDLFSLMHQEIAKSLVVLNEDGGIPIDKLPRPLALLANNIKDLNIEIGYPKKTYCTELIGTDASRFPFIDLSFNMTLANHSAAIEVCYNCLEETAIVTLSLFGHDRSARMSRYLPQTYLKSAFAGITLDGTPTCHNQQWKAGWQLRKGSPQLERKTLIQIMQRAIMGTMASDAEMFRLEEKEFDFLLQQPTSWWRRLERIYRPVPNDNYSEYSFPQIAAKLFAWTAFHPERTGELTQLLGRVPQLADEAKVEVCSDDQLSKYIAALKEHPTHLWQCLINFHDRGVAAKHIRRLLEANVPCDLICPNGKSPLEFALGRLDDPDLIKLFIAHSPIQAAKGERILQIITKGRHIDLIPLLTGSGAKLTPALLEADLPNWKKPWSIFTDVLPPLERLQPYLDDPSGGFQHLLPELFEFVVRIMFPKESEIAWLHYLIDIKKVDLSHRDEIGELYYLKNFITTAQETISDVGWSQSTNRHYLSMLDLIIQKTPRGAAEQITLRESDAKERPMTLKRLAAASITVKIA